MQQFSGRWELSTKLDYFRGEFRDSIRLQLVFILNMVTWAAVRDRNGSLFVEARFEVRLGGDAEEWLERRSKKRRRLLICRPQLIHSLKPVCALIEEGDGWSIKRQWSSGWL